MNSKKLTNYIAIAIILNSQYCTQSITLGYYTTKLYLN